MCNPHVIERIESRRIEIDPEFLDYLAAKCENIDTAIILGRNSWLGDVCRIILIVRNNQPVTIMFRRLSQSLDRKHLGVDKIIIHATGV